jgi:hypothetical protein
MTLGWKRHIIVKDGAGNFVAEHPIRHTVQLDCGTTVDSGEFRSILEPYVDGEFYVWLNATPLGPVRAAVDNHESNTAEYQKGYQAANRREPLPPDVSDPFRWGYNWGMGDTK